MQKKTINKDAVFIIFIIVISIIKLIIVNVQPLYARYNMGYDDVLFVNQANSIVEGNWLGEYNHKTLSKGIFTQLFMAGLYKIGVPFLLGQELFFILASITFIIMLKNIINNKKVLIGIFIILLFNPITYSSNLLRTYRDGVYISLLLYLVSFSFMIFYKYKEAPKKLVKYFIGLGLTITGICICREETIWIVPYIALSILITILFIIFDKECNHKIKKISLYSIPIIIYIAVTITIATLNYKYYNRFVLNDYMSKEFQDAYGALTRIITQEEPNRIPITTAAREKAYEVSPSFSKLKDAIEIGGKGWVTTTINGTDEIDGGYFFWTMRAAAEAMGYYKDAKTSKEYWQNVAKEINEACDSGRIENTIGKRSGLTTPFNTKYIPDLISEFINTIDYQSNFKNLKIDMTRVLKMESETAEPIFAKITRNKLEINNDELTNFDRGRIEILKAIAYVYQQVNPVIFYMALVLYIANIIFVFRKSNRFEGYKELLLISGIFLIYIARIFTITYIYVTAYAGIRTTQYLASTYVMQSLFSVVTIIVFLKNIKRIEEKRNLEKK